MLLAPNGLFMLLAMHIWELDGSQGCCCWGRWGPVCMCAAAAASGGHTASMHMPAHNPHPHCPLQDNGWGNQGDNNGNNNGKGNLGNQNGRWNGESRTRRVTWGWVHRDAGGRKCALPKGPCIVHLASAKSPPMAVCDKQMPV